MYGSGAMDPYIATRARPGRRDPRHLPHRLDVEQPAGLAAGAASSARTAAGSARRSRTDWDGETVAYECRPDHVTWATGCGITAALSPFGGRAKLVWNVDWAARWGLFGATIEGCGKDLATAGGSRDRADAISRQVFEREPPLNIPYEFLNIGGRKMSTSQGRARLPTRSPTLLPPDDPALPVPALTGPTTPSTSTRPATRSRASSTSSTGAPRPRPARPVRGELPPDPERIFAPQPGRPRPTQRPRRPRYRPPFRHLALLAQVPGVELEGASRPRRAHRSTSESAILDARTRAVRAWLEGFAPPEARIEVHRASLPDAVRGPAPEQRGFLARSPVKSTRSPLPSGLARRSNPRVFTTAKESGLGAGGRLRGPVRCVPRAVVRSAGRLAARVAGPRIRGRTAPRGRRSVTRQPA